MASPETHVCPNCGAPLGIPAEHERYFTCSFCGTALEDKAHDPASPETNVTLTLAGGTFNLDDLAAYTGPAVRAAKTGVRVVAIVVVASIVLPLVIAAVAIGAAVKSSHDSKSGGGGSGKGLDNIYNFSSGRVVDSDDESSPDLVTAARGKDGSHLLYVDFDAPSTLRWDTKLDVDDIGVYDEYLTTSQQVYTSIGDEVLAFNRRQGGLAWRAKLSDAIQHNICPGCFQLFGATGAAGDTIMTLSADGTLAAWNAGDGSALWAKTLDEAPREIVNFGGNPAVLDTDGTVTTVHVFNLADGSPAGTVPVSCPDTTFGDSERQEVGIYDYLQPVTGGGFVWVSSYPINTCAQRWDPGHFGPTWETLLPDGSNIPLDADNVAVSATGLHVAQNDTVNTFDLASGAVSTFTQADTDFSPIGVQDGVLVLDATNQRGTQKQTIEALDVATNNVKWKFQPTSGGQLDPSSYLFVTSDSWLATVTAKGVSVVQYTEDAKQLQFQMIPLGSGTASAPATLDLSGHGFSASPSFFGYSNGDLVMAADTDIVVVDPVTADVVKQGP